MDKICTRFVRTRSLITVDDLVQRYSLEPSVAADWLAKWTESGGFVRIPPNEQNSGVSQWADARHMRRMVEMSLSQRRRDVQSISPESWAAWVADRAFGTEMAHQKLTKAVLEFPLFERPKRF